MEECTLNRQTAHSQAKTSTSVQLSKKIEMEVILRQPPSHMRIDRQPELQSLPLQMGRSSLQPT